MQDKSDVRRNAKSFLLMSIEKKEKVNAQRQEIIQTALKHGFNAAKKTLLKP